MGREQQESEAFNAPIVVAGEIDKMALLDRKNLGQVLQNYDDCK